MYQGGEGLVDPEARPNVFRIAPADHGISFRFAEYLIPKGLKIAFLHDDTDYGDQGDIAFEHAFGHNLDSVAARSASRRRHRPGPVRPAGKALGGDRSAGVGGGSTSLAKVVRAVRGSGWDVPIYSPPSAEDPLLRQQLSDHPEWLDGLTFASGRMTAERGPAGPFWRFSGRTRSRSPPTRSA